MVDQYFSEIFEICDQSNCTKSSIHVLKFHKILKKSGNLVSITCNNTITKEIVNMNLYTRTPPGSLTGNSQKSDLLRLFLRERHEKTQ